MDAKDHPVIQVLGDQRRFVVPIYQRQYSWRTPRLQPFWEDVVAKAEEALEGKPKFSHYMGALILAPGGDGFTIGVTPRVQVVDGQQRLTTFQIFLAALREVGNRLGAPEVAEAVRNYLFNRQMTGDKDDDARFKLVPTPEDRAVFHLLVEGGLEAVRAKHSRHFFLNGKVVKGGTPNAILAMDYFVSQIERYARFGLADQDDAVVPAGDDDTADAPLRRLSALLEALLNHLKLVVITLSENDDAQVIFETLNSQAAGHVRRARSTADLGHPLASARRAQGALRPRHWR